MYAEILRFVNVSAKNKGKDKEFRKIVIISGTQTMHKTKKKLQNSGSMKKNKAFNFSKTVK